MGCSVSKSEVVNPGNDCKTFGSNAMPFSLGSRKPHLKLSLEEEENIERADALGSTIQISLSSADESLQNAETPRIGRLEKGGRRASAQVRETPALPLSPGSRLRYVNGFPILFSLLLKILMAGIFLLSMHFLLCPQPYDVTLQFFTAIILSVC